MLCWLVTEWTDGAPRLFCPHAYDLENTAGHAEYCLSPKTLFQQQGERRLAGGAMGEDAQVDRGSSRCVPAL